MHGLINASCWPQVPVPLESLITHVSIVSNNADVTCVFTYNKTSSEIKNTKFIFPIEATAAVYFFEAVIGETSIVAICRERVEAEGTFEEAVESGHSAFMLQEDYQMGDTFTMSLGNIPPNETICLTFKYVVPLQLREIDLALDAYACLKSPLVSVFSMPAKIGQRYDPGSEVSGDSLAAHISPSKISFTAKICSESRISAILSPQHSIKPIFLDDERKQASLSCDMGFLKDFELEIAYEDPHMLSVPCEFGKGDGFLGMHCVTASFLPEISNSNVSDGDKREIIFVVDRSGSMSGDRIKQTKESLLIFLKSLPKRCRFQIVGFGSTFNALFSEPVDYTKENLQTAMGYLSNMKADMGGTEVLPVLQSIYDTPVTGEGWYRQIIFLTDGDICNQNEVIGLIIRNQSNARLFSIGLGCEVSTSLLWGVARAGRGTATFIRDKENLRAATVAVLKAALQPMLTDVQLCWNVLYKGEVLDVFTVPSKLPPLFSGYYFTAFGLIPSSRLDIADDSCLEGTLRLSYISDKESRSLVATIQRLPMEHESLGLHRLAAKAQILELVDKQSAVNTDDDVKADLRQQIVAISTNANVISPFTSFVGVDPTKRAVIPPIPASRCPESACMGTPRAMKCMTLGSPMVCMDPPPCPPAALGSPMVCMDPPPCPPAANFSAIRAYNLDISLCRPRTAPDTCDNTLVVADTVVRVAQLQDFDGFWKMDEDLADLLKLKLTEITSSRPSEVTKNNAWATALVIAFLQTQLKTREDEWEMMVQKAMDWLQENNWGHVGSILESARHTIQTLVSL